MAGKGESVTYASLEELNEGKVGGKAIDPDVLASSRFGRKTVPVEICDAETAVTVGDGKAHFPIPKDLDGMNLVDCYLSDGTPSTSGLVGLGIYNENQAANVLSNNITIDENEKHSKDATTPKVIDKDHDHVAHGDLYRFDVKAAGTGTEGLWLELIFALP